MSCCKFLGDVEGRVNMSKCYLTQKGVREHFCCFIYTKSQYPNVVFYCIDLRPKMGAFLHQKYDADSVIMRNVYHIANLENAQGRS
jgi:hypothetical protein